MNRYPLWKYILLMALLLFGILYAMPNFFGEDPVLQISGSDGAVINTGTMSLLSSTLNNNDIHAKSIAKEDNNGLIVRLHSITEQMKAKALLQAALGSNYVVAQNLLGVTPKWLQDLGAQPMKLGLDLRGGMHFLLQVDVNSVIQKREKSDMRTFATALRKVDIRYAGIRPAQQGGVLIRFRDNNTRIKAETLLQTNYADYVTTEVTEGDQYYLRVALTQAALSQVRTYTMTQTMTVLRNRIDALGVAEPIISRQGLDRIVVELPGVQDMALAKQMLGGTATLQFHLVDKQSDLQSAVNGMVPLGSRLYHYKDGSPVLLRNQVVLSGNAISYAASSLDESGQPSVNLRLSGPQVASFSTITANNIGQNLGIVYVETKNVPRIINGKTVNFAKKVEYVLTAPTINSALGNNFQITNMQSMQLAKNLAIQLKAGALPANMYPIQEKNVGPSLGKANVERGLISVLAGLVLIIAFMWIYYHGLGLIANMALFFNVVFIVAVMSLLGVTLTLPGIAGIVLTMGMAVDANVLIFERIREEIRNGSTIQAAIHSGYERAFATIVDANVTTLIVAVVLFGFGTGPVQGFAVTLIVGLLTSMITAIMGTRAIVNLVYGGRPVKHLSIGM
jgi:preprotein translocase subunit SecD